MHQWPTIWKLWVKGDIEELYNNKQLLILHTHLQITVKIMFHLKEHLQCGDVPLHCIVANQLLLQNECLYDTCHVQQEKHTHEEWGTADQKIFIVDKFLSVLHSDENKKSEIFKTSNGKYVW